jgi:choline dehydrogenase-like flavoprotein
MLMTESTSFTKDVLGRYTCNTFDEAMASCDPMQHPGARPFDVIVIGAGAFGPTLAAHLFNVDSTPPRRHRTLLLDGGQFDLPEHIQNLPPMQGLGVPASTSIADLRNAGQDGKPRAEVWGLPWHSNVKFPGLAYCLGGRSVYFGGWCPQPIDSELTQWPSQTLTELKANQWPVAKIQIGSDTDNDFVFGPLHDALRNRLFAGLKAGAVTDAVGVAKVNDLDAPLAVQSKSVRPGFFPINKFSSVPLMMRASRVAEQESNGDDSCKRLMVVPNCHVTRLTLDGDRVATIETDLGSIPVAANAAVILAAGTIESTRLALLSTPNSNGLIGRNLMAHLRSNLTIRVPRASFANLPADVQTSALFVKGKHENGHFHLQITASGVTGNATDSEAELWKKIPDIDWLDAHAMANDDFVVITIRAIGEMFGDKSGMATRGITLDDELDEFGAHRAFVHMGTTPDEDALWTAMDNAALQVADVFADDGKLEFLAPRTGIWQPNPPTPFPTSGVHDQLGTTHHESGTLWMGTDPSTSVTDPTGRFHEVPNLYAAGPALFPQMGSPNPMLTGVALARLTAEAITKEATPIVETGFTSLFDGVDLTRWQMAGPGGFTVAGGALESLGGMGLLWYHGQEFGDFVLRLQWMALHSEDNSGVFIRFPDPHGDPWAAVNQGYEIQIHDTADPIHRTGAVYDFAPPSTLASKPVGQWNDYEIQAKGQAYTVTLNGKKVTTFTGTRDTSGFVGLQNHGWGSRVSFRNIRIKGI